MSAALQCHALHLYIVFSPLCLQQKIQPAILIKNLRPHAHDPRLQIFRPLAKGPIGRLRVHVYQPLALLHSDEVPGRFPFGPSPLLQPNLHTGPQKLPAPAGVFHMADHLLPLQKHMGNKSIRPSQKHRRLHFFVSH